MCGIVGLISKRSNGFYYQDADMLENLLTVDTMRGMDSTGAYMIMRNREVTTIKVASHPFHLFATDAWADFRKKMINRGKIVIGHNRKATQGAINSANAHPFVEDHIILVHNGTLRGGHDYLGDQEVDSHAICHAFAKGNAEDVIPTINGAFALVWWDMNQNKLFAIRNRERPLAFVETEDTMALCSEAIMAQFLYMRNDTKIIQTTMLDPGVLYSIDMNGKIETKSIMLKPQYSSTTTTYTTSHTPPIITAHKPEEKTTAVVPFRGGLHNSRGPSTDPNFSKSDLISIKINGFEWIERDNRVKAFGVVDQPSKPNYDVVGYLPKDVDLDLAGEYQNTAVTAIVSSVNHSNCGASIWCQDFRLDKIIKVHEGLVGAHQWSKLINADPCSECGSVLWDEEAQFTAVKVDKAGNYKAICPDCVEGKLKDATYKEQFQQRRYDALEDAVSISQVTKLLSDSADGPTSAKNLH